MRYIQALLDFNTSGKVSTIQTIRLRAIKIFLVYFSVAFNSIEMN